MSKLNDDCFDALLEVSSGDTRTAVKYTVFLTDYLLGLGYAYFEITSVLVHGDDAEDTKELRNAIKKFLLNP